MRVKRESTSEMAVITIVPTHVVVCDFVTRFPPPRTVDYAHAYGAEQD